MQKLYLELQLELDKLDCLRKNWTYFSLKRRELLKSFDIKQPGNVGNMECDARDYLD